MNGDTYYMSASEIASATQQYTSSLQSSLAGVNGVLNEVDSFINGSSAELQGSAWDTVRDHIGTYRDTIDSLRGLNQEIDSGMESALKIVQDFLEPDSDLNTADLPKFEAEKARLEQEIQNLEQQNAELAKVECEPLPCDDGSGGSCGEDCSARDAAQAQIQQNNIQIRDVLQPQLDEANRLIDKINKFVNEILPKVNAKLQELYDKVADFNQKVNDLVTSLPEGSSIRDKYEQQTRTYDLNTIEGRFLKIYDELTEKGGYSEWGAKAIIASMYGTNGLLLPDRFQGDNPNLPGYGLCQWEYAKNGGSVDTAQKMEDWCKANGYDHTTIEGQCAWIHHWLPILSEGYHIDNLNDYLSTGGEEDYYKMANMFSVYHQGTQGVEGKGYYRAMNKDLWDKFFPLIEQRESLKTANNINIEKPPTLQMGVPDSNTQLGGAGTAGSITTDTTQSSGSWQGGSYQANQGGASGANTKSSTGGGSISAGGGAISPSNGQGTLTHLSSQSGVVNDTGRTLGVSGTQNTQQLPESQKISYQDFVAKNSEPSGVVNVGSTGGGYSGGGRPYQHVSANAEPELVALSTENDGVIEPVEEQIVQLSSQPKEYTVSSIVTDNVKTPKIDFVENKPPHDLGPQPGEKLVEMSVTELTKGTPEEAVRNPVATAAIAALAVGAAGAATIATLKHDDDIDEDKIDDIKVKDYY